RERDLADAVAAHAGDATGGIAVDLGGRPGGLHHPGRQSGGVGLDEQRAPGTVGGGPDRAVEVHLVGGDDPIGVGAGGGEAGGGGGGRGAAEAVGDDRTRLLGSAVVGEP